MLTGASEYVGDGGCGELRLNFEKGRLEHCPCGDEVGSHSDGLDFEVDKAFGDHPDVAVFPPVEVHLLSEFQSFIYNLLVLTLLGIHSNYSINYYII